MAYVKPRIEITQDFESVPSFSDQPLAAFIFGPQYNLVTYAANKAQALVGSYVSGANTAYPWPSQPINTTVDLTYTQVYIDQVAAQYYPSAFSTSSNTVAKVLIPNTSAYYPNRVYSSTVVYQAGNGSSVNADFSNRGVQVGDTLQITDENGANAMTTLVTGFVPVSTPASLGSVTNAAGNVPTQSLADSVITPGGSYTNLVVSNGGTTGYVGYPTLGIMSDTVTATVTTAAGTIGASTFTITSANGAFAPVTGAVPVSNVLSLINSGGNVVSLTWTTHTGTPAVGMTWAIALTAANAQVTPTVAGTFTGAANTTYFGAITRGGPAYSGSNGSTCAQITFTSSGVDSSGPYNLATATPVAAGNYGVTMSIASAPATGTSDFILNDIYQFTATAAAPGAYQTLTFKDALSSALLAASSLKITLYETLVNQLIPQYQSGSIPNWIATESNITIESGITITDPLVVNPNTNQPQPLPITSGKVYVQHRDLMTANTTSIGSLTSPTQVQAALGTISPDNPLAQGVYNALLNSGGQAVYYVGVATNDINGYNTALALGSQTSAVYGLVPLTQMPDVLTAVAANVGAYSTPLLAKWRVAWLAQDKPQTTSGLFVMNGSSPWTATVSANPYVTPTQYSLFTVAGANFVTAGVRVGDVIRYNYATLPNGTITYNSFPVAQILTETQLISAVPLSAAVTTPLQFELWRVYTLDEQAANFGALAHGYDTRRIRFVYPSSVSQRGYLLAAACAGLASGVPPHQGLTNIQLLGLTDLGNITQFSGTQLDVMAGDGVWIVTQDAPGATAYIRHQLTTDLSSLNTQEDSITRNIDSISYALQTALAPFIGQYNITPQSQVLIYDTINAELMYFQTGTYTQTAGNQLISYVINSFTQNTTFQDRIDVSITLVPPYPFNYGFITLTV